MKTRKRKKKSRQIDGTWYGDGQEGRSFGSIGSNSEILEIVVLSLSYGTGLSWFNWWVSFAPEFQCCYYCESSCLFYLSFESDFCVSKIMHL